MRRGVLLLAAVAIPISGAFIGLTSGAASAASHSKIVCTSISGSLTSLTISGCTGGNTGGRSEPFSGTTLENGGVINWVSGSTTTFAKPTTASKAGKHCPGYVKGGSNNPSVVKFKGKVSADSGDNLKIPGKESGQVCVSSSLNITPYKPVKIS